MTLLDKISLWQKKRKKLKFAKMLTEYLRPTWLFDKGNYVWFLHGRKIMIVRDQIGHFIVYDNQKMVSKLLTSKEAAQETALNYVATEIIMKYYPKFDQL